MKMQMMAMVLAVVVAAVVSSAVPASAASKAVGAPVMKSFQDYFAGEWNVQRSVFRGARQEVDEAVVGHYSLQRDNVTGVLTGRSYDNETTTGEVSGELSIRVEFDGENGNKGTFFTGADEEELAALFDFDFRAQSNGVFIAAGAWKAAEGASFQFVAASEHTFVITVSGAEADGAALVFTGVRIPEEVEKTFFQKYGTMVMMGCFFMFNSFMQRKAHAQQGAPAAAGAAGAAAAPVSETVAKKDD